MKKLWIIALVLFIGLAVGVSQANAKWKSIGRFHIKTSDRVVAFYVQKTTANNHYYRVWIKIQVGEVDCGKDQSRIWWINVENRNRMTICNFIVKKGSNDDIKRANSDWRNCAGSRGLLLRKTFNKWSWYNEDGSHYRTFRSGSKEYKLYELIISEWKKGCR